MLGEEPHRRRFLKSMVASGVWFSIPRGSTAAPATTVHEIRAISRQPHLYHGWPTVTRRRNGELLLVYSGGREHHVCPFGRVELMRSRDGGQSWSAPRIVMDGPIDDRDAGVLETTRGTILITTFTSLAYEPILQSKDAGKLSGEQRARWMAAHERVNAEQRQRALDVWMIRSTDEGVTFSGRYRPLVNSPHGPVQLTDGRLLYAGKMLWSDDRRVGFAHSSDDGQNWQWLATLPTRDGDDARDNYHELHAVEAANGRLIAHIRNHNSRHHRETLQSESDDGGHSWTMPHSIGVWGLPSHLLRLRDGRLLMSYGYRRKPYGNQARISKDHGLTWSDPMLISGDGSSGDLGYPSTVQLTDGSLVTVWYERMESSSHAVLRQAHWSLG